MFRDGRELEYKQKPQDLLYMKILSWNMNVGGIWPRKLSKNVLFYRVNAATLLCATVTSSCIYIVKGFGRFSFVQLGHTYITVAMSIVALVRLSLNFGNRYEAVASEFFNVIHLLHHKAKTEYAEKMKLHAHKFSHYLTLYIVITWISTYIFFNALPMYNNIMSGAFSHDRPANVTYLYTIYHSLPVNYDHDIRVFIPLTIYNMYIAYFTGCIFMLDVLVFLMVIHSWGHLKILIYDLTHFPLPGGELTPIKRNVLKIKMYSDTESVIIHKKLIKVIVHHRTIATFVARISSAFGYIIANEYMFYLVCCCILLLECSQMDLTTVALYGPVTITIYALLIQTSIMFELLASMTDPLTIAVYELPWEHMNTSNRKLVQILLLQAQKPLGLKAMGVVDVGLRTMATILKSSISYFIMLRTFSED